MTRNEEYQALLPELETTPAALDGAVERALRRRKRDRRLRRTPATATLTSRSMTSRRIWRR